MVWYIILITFFEFLIRSDFDQKNVFTQDTELEEVNTNDSYPYGDVEVVSDFEMRDVCEMIVV